mgnify:CR=1 FL=1
MNTHYPPTHAPHAPCTRPLTQSPTPHAPPAHTLHPPTRPTHPTRRRYPSATLLPDGRALVMGGTQGVGAGTANNPFWEIYDWATNGLQQFAMRPGYLDSANQVRGGQAAMGGLGA